MTAPTIISITCGARFRYLWLKSVYNVDLSVHCAKCLKGVYCSSVTPHTNPIRNVMPIPAPFYYLCGVSRPYVWENNFHLAFVYSKGGHIDITRNGIHVVIDNATEFCFSSADIDMNDKNARKREFCTCRNWQFAHAIKDRIKFI